MSKEYASVHTSNTCVCSMHVVYNSWGTRRVFSVLCFPKVLFGGGSEKITCLRRGLPPVHRTSYPAILPEHG
jgi:hypothetical protein